MTNLLITGGAGFIGSNFVRYWCKKYPRDRVVVLDALTYAGNQQNLSTLEGQNSFRFVRGDIRDRVLLDTLLETETIDAIVHFAAESHVDRSIISPDAFLQTNIFGTYTLLEACRHARNPISRFLHVSTDEVYGSLGPEDPPCAETTPYSPNSPYAASKASSDHLVRAYHQTYGLPTLITNSSNNYGPYQFPEKLIPLMCVNILLGKPLPVYGDGQNVRDWLFVADHCRALDCVLTRGQPGETYNIGGDNQVTNIDLVTMLCQLMDQLVPDLPIQPSQRAIAFVRDRPGHDRRYALNSRKIREELGWTPGVSLEEGLGETARWYRDRRDWWQPLLEGSGGAGGAGGELYLIFNF
ncbi:MAG: dTDP-glucose 4,6-dehydratase [Cyanobacteriota bacterium]|nr:dTDP-glucose 4,6-dehydratase [Cyanobacteriota bacterium]